jgi:hypothetical protein
MSPIPGPSRQFHTAGQGIGAGRPVAEREDGLQDQDPTLTPQVPSPPTFLRYS